MSLVLMAFKQKKRVKNARSKYLKPGALAQIRYSRTSSRTCTDIGKKRILLDSEKAEIDILPQDEAVVHNMTPISSPIRTSFQPIVDGITPQKMPAFTPQKMPKTPKTPQVDEFDSPSRLESLPLDLLV